MLTPPHRLPTIAQCLRKPISATHETRFVVAVLSNHATHTRTRVRRPLTPRHLQFSLAHRRPDGPLTSATAACCVHFSNWMYLNHSGISARTQGLRGHCRHASWRRTLPRPSRSKQINQFTSQHASRLSTQQSVPYNSTTASSTARHVYPSTGSGNLFPFRPRP